MRFSCEGANGPFTWEAMRPSAFIDPRMSNHPAENLSFILEIVDLI